jgi:hypothetical protein
MAAPLLLAVLDEITSNVQATDKRVLSVHRVIYHTLEVDHDADGPPRALTSFLVSATFRL